MTKVNPRDRISAPGAALRMSQLQNGYSYDTLERAREMTSRTVTLCRGLFVNMYW